MSRSGITYQAVSEAANSLKKRGEEPTITKIRVELGGTGSLSTISNHLNKYRELSEEVIQEDLPVELEKVLMSSMTQVWNCANEFAKQDHHKLKKIWDEKEAEFEKEKMAFLEENRKLEEMLEKTLGEFNGAEKVLRENVDKILDLSNKNLVLQEENKMLKSLLMELTKDKEAAAKPPVKKQGQESDKNQV